MRSAARGAGGARRVGAAVARAHGPPPLAARHPLCRQVLAARLEVERLDDLLMRISLIAGPRHPRARRIQ